MRKRLIDANFRGEQLFLRAFVLPPDGLEARLRELLNGSLVPIYVNTIRGVVNFTKLPLRARVVIP